MKKRILVITTHPIQYHAPLFAYLTKHGDYQLKVLYTSGKGSGALYDAEFGKIRSWNIDLLKGYDYEFLRNNSKKKEGDNFFSIRNPDLFNEINVFNPAILMIFGWKHYSHFQVMRHYKGKIPIVFRGDSTTLDDWKRNYFKTAFRYASLRWIYNHVDFVFSPGTASDEYFLKAGFRSRQIYRAAHAVDNDWFKKFSGEEREALDRLKSQFHITEDETIFLFAGKFTPKKNPLFLISAFCVIATDNPGARLFLVGDGILEKKIKSKCQSLHDSVAQRITILPFQDQPSMKLFYRLANVFVLPSQGPGETWGLSVNEALACGTPVIVSSKCGCAADLVKDTVNGFVFDSGNIASLRSKMSICCDKQISNQLSANAFTTLESFGFNSFKAAIDRLMQSFG